MGVIPWGPGRIVTLTIRSGQTESDILDLGAIASRVSTGIVAPDATVGEIPTSSLIPGSVSVDQFKGKNIVFRPDTTTAALRNQQRAILASTTDGVLTVTDLTDAPVEGDVFDIHTVLDGRAYRRWDITVLGPATVTGTVNPQVSNLSTANFVILQSGGSNIVLPTSSKATPLIPVVARYLKLVGTSQGQHTHWILMGTTIDIGR